MKVYRLAFREYIRDMTGAGARLYGGRWNPKGVACLYTSEHVSLALLEKFAHAQGKEDMTGLMLLEIEIPDEDGLIYHVNESRMVDDWMDNFDYSQWMGQQILDDAAIVAFSVPSAIVRTERNVIINPQAARIAVVNTFEPVAYDVDTRFLDRLI